ncbi:glucosamine-6-phosphate deaminase [Streptococcus alactolyticus]|uniref:Glucosamine-6-phosphate deaminase n=1 Tax=Candidatus Streptococcus faecavium TaxID=2838763 RepID=A0A9D2FVX4_9STRE|nr:MULTISPECIES: glucosamine-6-phosphate deaminase [Streptococcus]MBD9119589.1 glucosamine-6-phosphate deaminase [Streptococcus sp.]MBM6698200.1 glucosamine-6-phosphate deaminase [Streptococcus alactolyticus]HIZ67631.1 glucosamine-6-phosphate deaminase [Candidatus Streptococcus faecavium]
MRIIRVQNQIEGGQVAFSLLKDEMAKGAKTLGLATGSTPLAFYDEIRKSDLDFSDMTSVNLDEYVGLAADNDQSYHHFMQENLFRAKSFQESFLPNGLASDLQEETRRYDQVIAEHPIDFQILGIGHNGHIGFNEPGTSFDVTTHVVNLAEDTIKANSRFFDSIDDVPKQAISMGIQSIMQSKMIVLMAYGQGKADAIKQMIEGPVTEDLPASVLQKHPNVVVIVDEAAASALD